MTATKIQPGDDLHLTSLMAPHSLNFVTGADRAALLAYGRDVFAAGLAGAAPAAVAPQGDKDDSLLLCASDLQHSAIYDSHSEMQDCARSVADRIKALAAPALEAPPAVAPQGEGWRKPTTYLQRFGDAIALLCHGRRPDDLVLSSWLDGSSFVLQQFAIDNGPAWAQGIGLIDAATIAADQPTEGVAHEMRADRPAAVAGPAIDRAATLAAIDDLSEPSWTGYECPNTWADGLSAARAVVQSAPAAPALEAPAAVDGDQLDSLARQKLGALLNAFGEAQWQAGRGVPCPSIEDAFEAVISAAVALLAAAPQAPAQETPEARGATDDAIDAIVLRQTGFDGDGYQAMTADELRRIVRSALGELAAAPQAPAAPWKDHQTARLVNDLRDCAIKYHGAGQLRERIAHIVVPLCDQLKGALAAPAAPAVDALAPVQALLDVHAALLDANPYAYFELAYTRQTGWMAWITDKPMYGAQLINPDRKVLARGQGDTAAAACAAAAQAKEGGDQ
ncbi:hypothetical protein [Delftia deserti]|uniref:hypothetical protein n=1 Tax=Delftia deserti TaxID=1651218 RepID=UPI00360A3CC4